MASDGQNARPALVATRFPVANGLSKHGTVTGYALSPYAHPLAVKKTVRAEVHFEHELNALLLVRLVPSHNNMIIACPFQ